LRQRISSAGENRRWDDTCNASTASAASRLKTGSSVLYRRPTLGTGMTACGKLLKLTNPANASRDRDRDRPRAAMLVEQKAGRYVLDASVPVGTALRTLEPTDSGGRTARTVSVTELNRARSGSGPAGQGERQDGELPSSPILPGSNPTAAD